MDSQDEQVNCPQCGVAMVLRLGMYECPDCGHEMEPPQPEVQEEDDDECRPLERREGWQLPKGKTIQASSQEEFVSFRQGLKEMTQVKQDKTYNVAPGLVVEKIIVLVLIAGIGFMNVYAPLTDQGVVWTYTGVYWKGALAIELIRLGLTIAVFYIPFIPLKWAGIGVFLVGTGLTVTNLLFLASDRGLLFYGMPVGLNARVMEIDSWMLYSINLVVFISAIGVLGRDIFKIHSS